MALRKPGKRPEPTLAAEGLRFALGGYADRRREYTVGPKCSGPPEGGAWICTTHEERFGSNFEKDSHLHLTKGPHVLAWWCFDHGPEVP